MKNLKFKIYTLGCKVNQCDSGILSQHLVASGFDVAKDKADLAIINTCTVTKIAARKSRQMISVARRDNPGAKIIMFGCYPEIYLEEVKKLDLDLVWQMGNFNKLTEELLSLFNKKIKAKSLEFLSQGKIRYTIKIEEGCEQFCTYCIIPYTRGKVRSRKEMEILRELEQAIKHGFQEIIITGTHLGLYGRDRDTNLFLLLKKIVKMEGLGRIRLSSVEINEVSDDLIDLIRDNVKICPHVHISLQSGSDKILKLMNRPYDKEFFKKRINKIKQAIPNIAITTDIIVGFPSETEDDFVDSCRMAEELAFSKIHVFSFSAHEKTPAFKFAGQVDSREIKQRSDKLHLLGERMEKEYIKKMQKEKLHVLVERKVDGCYYGKSEYYFEQEICGNKDLKIGEITVI